jgi:hypothetical protein
MWEFLARNGTTFKHPNNDLMGTARAIEDLAANLVSETDFIAWVLKRIS